MLAERRLDRPFSGRTPGLVVRGPLKKTPLAGLLTRRQGQKIRVFDGGARTYEQEGKGFFAHQSDQGERSAEMTMGAGGPDNTYIGDVMGN